MVDRKTVLAGKASRALALEDLEQRMLLTADLLGSAAVANAQAIISVLEDGRLEPCRVATSDAPSLTTVSSDGDSDQMLNRGSSEARSADAVGDHYLRMIVPTTYRPGVPILVRVQLEQAEGGPIDRSLWDTTVQLSTDDPSVSLASDSISLVNGLGSVLLDIQGNASFTLTAKWADGEVSASASVAFNDVQPQQVSAGVLEGESTVWSGVVQLTGDVTIPSGHVLTIEPGTTILLDGKAQSTGQIGVRLRVEGTLQAVATESASITFTATDPLQPWGELNVAGGQANLEYVNLHRAGSSPRGGHTDTGPAIRLSDGGIVTLQHSNVTDIAGKILQASSGTLNVYDSLLSRAVMGPEINNTQLDFQRSWIVEMAGKYHHQGTVDDNDGIYLHEQRDGQSITMLGGVVASVQDDGIDTLGARAIIEDVYVRDVTDKTISVFHGEVIVRRSLLVNADIGIEAKGTGNSTVHVSLDQVTIANVDKAIRAHDKGSPDPNVLITYDIQNSILHTRPGGDPLLTDYDARDLHVNYTWVNEAWDFEGSGEGLILSQPSFADLQNNDYGLEDGSPAIDAGNPTSPLDPDGSRVDLGFLTYSAPESPLGDFDQDGNVTAGDIDLLCAAIQSNSTDPRWDLTKDGSLDETDLTFMVRDVLGTTRGDANLDGRFDSSDLVTIFQLGEYEDAIVGNSGWASGDWNCDNEFTTSDLVAAFQDGGYVA